MRQTDLSAILAAAAKKNEGPKVLTLDIETMPGLCGYWNEKVPGGYISKSMIRSKPRVACFAAKWLHSKKVEFHSEYHDGRGDMLAHLWRLLDEADVLVTFNGNRFDIKHINAALALAGYTPPSPYRSVDLYSVSKSQFSYASHRLDDIAQEYGIGQKVKHEGMDLWWACFDGDDAAWGRMRKYNRMDVLLTERLLDEYGGTGWVKGLPHMGQWNGNPGCCYACGGTNLADAGTVRTLTLSYPLKRCEDCGARNKVLRNGQTRAV